MTDQLGRSHIKPLWLSSDPRTAAKTLSHWRNEAFRHPFALEIQLSETERLVEKHRLKVALLTAAAKRRGLEANAFLGTKGMEKWLGWMGAIKAVRSALADAGWQRHFDGRDPARRPTENHIRRAFPSECLSAETAQLLAEKQAVKSAASKRAPIATKPLIRR